MDWLWLAIRTDITAKGKAALCAHFPSSEAAFAATEQDLREVSGLTARECAALCEHREDYSKPIELMCRAQEIDIIPITDPRYPNRLKEIYAPPLVLFVKGKLTDIDNEVAVAVIGTRSPSANGYRSGEFFARELGRSGALLLTGLTDGLELYTAEAAIAEGGRILAVLGTPHEKLDKSFTAHILAHGAIVSEYAPGTQPYKYFYRDRNRITSGLSLAVVAVEAPEKSGVHLFVAEALEQGKEVYAIPGSIDNPKCAGSNAMLREGAAPATCSWDVLESLSVRYPGKVRRVEKGEIVLGSDWKAPERAEKPTKKAAKPTGTPKKEIDKPKRKDYTEPVQQPQQQADPSAGLTEEQRLIAQNLGAEPTDVDTLAARCGMSIARVLTLLTILTVKGIAKRLPGGRVMLNTTKK